MGCFWVCGGEEWLGIDQKCEFWAEKGAKKYKNGKKQRETVRVRALFEQKAGENDADLQDLAVEKGG